VLYHRITALFPPDKDSIYRVYEEKYLKGKTTVERGLELLDSLQKKHGFKSLLFIIPVFQENLADYKFRFYHELVKKMAESYPDIAVIDLFEDFKRLGNDSTKYAWDGMIHPNLKGHEVIAERLYREIRARWLLGQTEGS
jgi:lysophospholipase L1-like esterase